MEDLVHHPLEGNWSSMKPKGKDTELKYSKGVLNAVISLLSGLSGTRQYPLQNVVRYFALPAILYSSTLGMGYGSNFLTLLSLRKSRQNQRLPSFLGTRTISSSA